MEKMFIEALSSLKGGKKKLRELLDTVLEELEQAQNMREVWATKAQTALEAKELIEQKLGRGDTNLDAEVDAAYPPKDSRSVLTSDPFDKPPKDSLGE